MTVVMRNSVFSVPKRRSNGVFSCSRSGAASTPYSTAHSAKNAVQTQTHGLPAVGRPVSTSKPFSRCSARSPMPGMASAAAASGRNLVLFIRFFLLLLRTSPPHSAADDTVFSIAHSRLSGKAKRKDRTSCAVPHLTGKRSLYSAFSRVSAHKIEFAKQIHKFRGRVPRNLYF